MRSFPGELTRGTAYAHRLWTWKYGPEAGRRHSLVALHGPLDHRIAHVGGLPSRTRLFGDERLTVQSVDNMVDPAHRFRDTGRGVFSELLRDWWSHCILEPGAACAWGFPTLLNLRVGARAADYGLVEHLVFLAHPSTSGAAGAAASGCRVEQHLSPPPQTDALWTRCSPELDVALVRDRAYLEHRYTRHPSGAFTFLTCVDRSSGELRGLAVTKPWSESPDVLGLMDWLVPLADREATDALLAAASAQAARCGASTLGTWFPTRHPWAAAFRARGFWPRRTRRPFVARLATRDLDLTRLRDHVYATPGDADIT